MRVDSGGARGPRPTWRQRFMQMGGQSRPPLRDGTARAPSTTGGISHKTVGGDAHIAPRGMRNPRRGTRAPPYMATALYADGRTESSAPTEWDVEGGGSYRVGRRGRRPLQSGTLGTPPLRSTSDRRTCRAGPVCPAARCALAPAGHADPALHGDSALCRWADSVVRPYGVGCRGRRLLQSGT